MTTRPLLPGALALRAMFAATLLALPGLHAASRDERVHAATEKHRAGAVQWLERMVNIDTGTGHVEGLEKLTGLLVAELKALGAGVELASARPVAGENVVATFTGSGRGRILLLAHMDTVFQAGTVAERPFRVDSNRALGPGVVDDKGGIVLGLYALRILRELDFKDFGVITFFLNSNEETGSLGSRRLIESLARKHDVALNLEAGRLGDKLVSWRKGSAVLEVTVKGKSAHAGVAPESGRNAALEIAHQVLQLGKLANAEKLTSVNFTVIQSGDRSNVIPEAALAKADVRAATEDEFARVERDMVTIARNKLIPETEVTVKLNRSFPPFARNPATDALLAKAQGIYGELGRVLGAEGTGGAADSSLTAGAGTPSLDGLGLIGGKGHSPEEYAELDSLVPRLYLLTRLLMELGPGK